MNAPDLSIPAQQMGQQWQCYWPYLIGALFATIVAARPMGIIVRRMYQLLDQEAHGSATLAQGNWRPTLLGVTERLFYYLALTSGAQTIVAAWFAAKVFDRWTSSEERKKTFLVGSMLSLLHAASALPLTHLLEQSEYGSAMAWAGFVLVCDLLVWLYLGDSLHSRRPLRRR